MNPADAKWEFLDTLCPMHVVVGKSGHVIHCGPTLAKLRNREINGLRFLEVFELRRPRGIFSMTDLRKREGDKLHLQFRDEPRTGFKGVLVRVDSNEIVINLSFGISVVDAVRDYKLSSGDFTPTDMTIEMLYLVEAKSAAMEASRKLNQRLEGARIAAEEQAFTDTLTGLKNRRALDHILGRYQRGGTEFALMQVDLDWFKAVNDTLGHAAGDHVLQEFASVLVDETREPDTVARVGGDEFTIVLPDLHNAGALEGIGRRIVDRLVQPIMFQGDECKVSASIGTAIFKPGSGIDLHQVVENADIALYASKRAGRARQTLFHPGLKSVDTSIPIGRADADSQQ